MATCRARNAALTEAWRREHPGADAAVLEIVTTASGQTRRRLRGYREFTGALRDTPGRLIQRFATTLASLDLDTVAICAAAARVEVTDIEWSLLTVTEALERSP